MFPEFKIRKSERLSTLLSLLLLLPLHYLMVHRFWALFADFTEAHFQQFSRNYHMSGFDYYTYDILNQWHHAFDIVRHPLLAEIWYPGYLLNRLLWTVTGCNCAQLIVASVLLFCGVYSFVFVRRTLTDVIGVKAWMATMLTLFFYSFGLILVTLIVPDHFCLSLLCLTLTIYLSGKKMKAGEKFTILQTVLLFGITSGITLSNGAMTLLAVLFVNGRSFWHPRYLTAAVIVPSLLMLTLAFGLNRLCAKDAVKATSPLTEQTKWTSTEGNSRMAILQQNFFGESLQLHRRYVLGDTCWKRPVLVEYTWAVQNYVIIVIQLLLIAAIVAGRRERLAWLLTSVIAFNLLLHIVIGFAITEVYIMVAHWAFTIPLLLGYLLVPSNNRISIVRHLTLLITLSIAIYFYAYHGYLLHRYLTWPLAK